MKSILVAYDKNYGIGAANDLLWLRDLPSDLKRFKELTTDNVIIMGRKTYDSIGRALPNRQNIVVSREAAQIDGVTVVASMEDAYAAAEPGKEIFVIGGGQMYRLAIDTVDRIYATEVGATFPAAEIFFPPVDTNTWKETSREHHEPDERNKYAFDFVIYDRR